MSALYLSQHFTLAEFIRSDAADKLGDPNMPTAEHLSNLRITAYAMECVRAELGGAPLSIMSAYRNPRVNKAVGGVATSHHALGLACDFRSARYAPFEAATRLAASRLPFEELILETSRDIVHMSFYGTLKREILTQRGAAGSAFAVGIVQ